MSFFTNTNKLKKRFFQAENPNQDENELLLGKKKQISVHGSPISLILRNIIIRFCDLPPGFTTFPYEIRLGFSFDFQRFKELWKEIEKTIKRHNWKQIRILSLAFDGKYRGALQDFERMASLFSKSFSDLTTLSLREVKEGNDAKFGLCLISEIGKNFLNLRDLQIHFDYESNLNECLQLLAMETLGRLVRLRHFSVDFGASRTLISDEINLLCEGINRKSPKLISLALDFGSCRNFNDECLKILGSKLCRGLSELNSLVLTVGMNEISNQGVMSLSNFLSFDLQKLHKLNIDFFDCKYVTLEGFVSFGEKIAENLQNLQELSFCFGVQPLAEDNEDFKLIMEKERVYRNEIEEKLNKIFHFIPPNSLDLDSEVVWG